MSNKAVEEAVGLKIRSAMPSQQVIMRNKKKFLSIAENLNITDIAISRDLFATNLHFIKTIKESGIKIYVYNLREGQGFNEQYVIENEMRFVYGMYADNYVPPSTSNSNQ